MLSGSQIVSLLENVLFESATAAGHNAVTTGTISLVPSAPQMPINTIVLSNTISSPLTLILDAASEAGAPSTGAYHVSLGFDTLADSFGATPVDISHAVSEPQAIDLAAAAAGTLAAASAKLERFQFGGNTYLVDVTNAGAASTHTALAATDYVVKLAGLIDLSAGSFNGGHTFTL
jgi:hypothetical protein